MIQDRFEIALTAMRVIFIFIVIYAFIADTIRF